MILAEQYAITRRTEGRLTAMVMSGNLGQLTDQLFAKESGRMVYEAGMVSFRRVHSDGSISQLTPDEQRRVRRDLDSSITAAHQELQEV